MRTRKKEEPPPPLRPKNGGHHIGEPELVTAGKSKRTETLIICGLMANSKLMQQQR
jgi:hypothetical protein